MTWLKRPPPSHKDRVSVGLSHIVGGLAQAHQDELSHLLEQFIPMALLFLMKLPRDLSFLHTESESGGGEAMTEEK